LILIIGAFGRTEIPALSHFCNNRQVPFIIKSGNDTDWNHSVDSKKNPMNDLVLSEGQKEG